MPDILKYLEEEGRLRRLAQEARRGGYEQRAAWIDRQAAGTLDRFREAQRVQQERRAARRKSSRSSERG